MIRLLWKEFREQGVWGLIWAVSLIGLGTMGHAQSICGMIFPSIGPMIFVSLISAIVGAGAYSSELTGDRADFACTRPMPWSQLLLAKVLFAAVTVVCSAAISSVILRIITPEPYQTFATPVTILQGAIPLIITAWISYLVGTCFSVTLSGLAGGVISLMAAVLIYIIFGIASSDVKGQHDIIYFWLTIGGLAGSFSGLLVIIRSRLSLPVKERVIRFGRIFLICLAVMWVVRLVTPDDIISSRVPDAYQQAIFSPDGEYVVMTVGRSGSIFWSLIPGGVDNKDETYYMPTRSYLIRLRDRHISELPKKALGHTSFNDTGTVVYNVGTEFYRLHMKPDGTLEHLPQ